MRTSCNPALNLRPRPYTQKHIGTVDSGRGRSGRMQQRLFRVRALAYIVDLLLYYFAAAAIFVFLAKLLPVQVLVPSIMNVQACYDLVVDRDDPVIVALQTPSDAILFKKQCTIRQMFINRVDLRIVGYAKAVERVQVMVSYPVDEDGKAVPFIDTASPGALLLPFVAAFFVARRGATPGKSLFYLRIQTRERKNPSYRRALLRELVRFAPWVMSAVIALPTMWTALLADPIKMAEALGSSGILTGFNPLPGLALVLIVSIAALWFLFGSFIRWNGQAYWDRVAGLYVYDVGDESIPSR